MRKTTVLFPLAPLFLAAITVSFVTSTGHTQEQGKETWLLQYSQRCRGERNGSGIYFIYCPDVLTIPDGSFDVVPGNCGGLNVDPIIHVMASGVLKGPEKELFEIKKERRVVAVVHVGRQDKETLSQLRSLLNKEVELAIQKLGAKPRLEGAVAKEGVPKAVSMSEWADVDGLGWRIYETCYMRNLTVLFDLYKESIRLVIREKRT